MVFYKGIQLQLLLSFVTASATALATGSPQVVYVDYGNGTSDPMCWTGGPCNSLDLVLEGAQLLNSTVVVLQSGQQSVGEVRPNNSTCPAWFVPASNSTHCSCGNTLGGIVRCNETRKELLLFACYCMTNDEHMGLVVGGCAYNCNFNGRSYSPYRHFYNNSKYSVNDEICGPLNRRGRLCGQCKERFSPPVYSYDLRCVKCNSTDYSHYNWVKYIAVAFVPLTIFYIVVVAFRISATSPLMNGFVLVSQVIAAPSFVRITIFALDLSEKFIYYELPARIFFTLYGIWNLDFFRTLIPPICLPVDTLTTIAMDYAVALYPLVLIVITYIFIELHAHNCRLIVLVWKPFHWCLARFRRQWNMKRSVIDAFATFLLLSYFKLLSISFSLLIPTYLHNVNGVRKGTSYLYYDATVEAYGEKHRPYAILAIMILLVFIFLPLVLLILYPLSCFQKCLTYCKLNHHVLRTFTDTFQGSFKDGTNGTRDCRYFAAFYLIIRIVPFATYAIISTDYFFLLAAIIFTAFVFLISTIRPYKKDVHNKIDTFLFLCLASFYLSLFSLGPSLIREVNQFITQILILVLSTLPSLYMVGLLVYWLCIQSPWIRRNVWFLRRNEEREVLRFPDRVLHPEEYDD